MTFTVYHGTPYQFDALRPGSWVARSLLDACLHLFLLNNEKGGDPLGGWICIFSEFDMEMADCIAGHDGSEIMTTMDELAVTHRQSLKHAITTLDPEVQCLFGAEVTDLTQLLRGQ